MIAGIVIYCLVLLANYLWVLQGRIQGPHCDINFYINVNVGFGLKSSDHYNSIRISLPGHC